ncbi:penicillin-binding protein 1C [Leptospira fluminis]|uniref:peptidoglycan glycosyltransferase n=1 Tax=Leptospira fluminis TaxID=2484979 RepID=A0A4R9GKK9_9LEPT|nr:penicillin-binding protein 1C [Leptospira fluminis]TGK14768.1 penicillin-binding protein 1C [Leptospira fluminis]
MRISWILLLFFPFAFVGAEESRSFFSEEIRSGRIPSFSEIRSATVSTEGILLDRNGIPLQKIRLDHTFRRLSWTDSSEIPEALVLALIAQEDRRFPFHGGVDLKSVLGAIKDRMLGGPKRGASTITMQLAGLLIGSKPGRRSLSEKWEQMKVAWKIESSWSKQEILEAYINLIPFQGEFVGIRAASRGLFGADPSALGPEEAIALVALLPNPGSSQKNWIRRGCWLSSAIGRSDLCQPIREIVPNLSRKGMRKEQEPSLAYHAAHKIWSAVEGESGTSESFRSTLDANLQISAGAAMDRVLSQVSGKNVKEAGILVIENRTGAILVYLGNSKSSRESFFVDAIRARRQAGSTLKPFLYALAFEKNLLTPESLLMDRPKEWELVGGSYKPGNYEERYNGSVPAKIALASSLNVPAVQVLDWTGVPEFVSRLSELGFHKLKNPDHYGLSLALGTADVTLWELVNAYRTLANDGLFGVPTFDPEEAALNGQFWKEGETDRFRRIYRHEAVTSVKKILSSREDRAPTFGWENHLSTRFFTFVKTGTSQDMRDNWCIGSSGDYTVGVWMGNMSGEPMHDVSGVTGAAPLWKEIITILEEVGPSSIVTQNTVPDAKPSLPISSVRGGGRVRIRYPESGNLFALDPEIPEENERIRFEAGPAISSLEWILNGTSLGAFEGNYYDWKPKRGKFLLSVRLPGGVILDTVAFQVR